MYDNNIEQTAVKKKNHRTNCSSKKYHWTNCKIYKNIRHNEDQVLVGGNAKLVCKNLNRNYGKAETKL